jgi:tRNA nucleotidyltransferase (CCA-adding enzyme)
VGFPTALDIPESILQIARTLEAAGHEAWCVGGTLRDALLGHPHSDFDLATSATPEEVQRLFPRTVAIGVKYGTVGVLDRQRIMHEVTTFRRDVTTDGRHAVVEYGVSLEQDLARRDFTINAIAYHPIRQEWRDPFGGYLDLERGLVRAVGKPGQRFEEDYLRILRALRFAARFDFEIDPPTWAAARAASPGLVQLSAERVRDEWFKGLRTARSLSRFATLWIESGGARIWVPELEHGPFAEGRVTEPSASVRDPVLLTGLLTSTPTAVLRRLKASNAEVERAQGMETGPQEPTSSDSRSVRRWLSAVGPSADDLMALWALRQAREPSWAETVREVRRRKDPLTRSDLAVTGSDLQALGAAGPEIGRILAVLLERVLDDPSLNRRDRLLALARDLR